MSGSWFRAGVVPALLLAMLFGFLSGATVAQSPPVEESDLVETAGDPSAVEVQAGVGATKVADETPVTTTKQPFNPYVVENGPIRYPEGTVVPPTEDGAPQGYITYKTPWEVYLTGAAIVVLGISVSVLAFMGRKSGLTQNFTRAFLLVTIIFAALFLIAAGYSDEQAAPVYGLLGTILGYLFGRSENKDTPQAAPAPPEN